MIWTISALGGWGGLERADFCQFSLCDGLVVLKGLILKLSRSSAYYSHTSIFVSMCVCVCLFATDLVNNY